MNSIAGFKFWDIKRWFLSEKFDVLIISETKLDSTFPASQFHVGGYCLYRADRKRSEKGLVVFVKNNIYCFTTLTEFQWLQANEWAGFNETETIALRLKVSKSWLQWTTFHTYSTVDSSTEFDFWDGIFADGRCHFSCRFYSQARSSVPPRFHYSKVESVGNYDSSLHSCTPNEPWIHTRGS